MFLPFPAIPQPWHLGFDESWCCPATYGLEGVGPPHTLALSPIHKSIISPKSRFSPFPQEKSVLLQAHFPHCDSLVLMALLSGYFT